MKLDKYFSYVYVCPTSKLTVSNHMVLYSGGICYICGYDNNSTVTHAVKIIGKWKRPSLLEWIKGKRKMFVELSPIGPNERCREI